MFPLACQNGKYVRVILFNVGHGFCAFLKSGTGSTLLIDCGSSERFSPIKYIRENELHDAVPVNGKLLTEFIVSHPHDDHIKDISRVIEELPPYLLLRNKFKWDDVKTPGTNPSKYENLDNYAAWQESYSAPPTVTPNWGRMKIQHFKVPQVLVSGSNNFKAVNNSSFAVIVTFEGTQYTHKLLFGGDLEESGWKALLQSDAEFRAAVVGTTLYFASHHGHKSGFSSALFKAMGRKPHLNLISVTENDDSVDGSYSDNAGGVYFGTEQRFTLTTRTHGSIFIDVDDTGRATVTSQDLPDNLEPKAAAPDYILSLLNSLTPPQGRK
jgi:beta-lactamase superfamily II metal-dependent hydrolase